MSSIINGKYYPDSKNHANIVTNSQYKNWNHQRQREDHAKDIIQAHKKGKPNPDFIREYPESSKGYFPEDDIRKYGNEY